MKKPEGVRGIGSRTGVRVIGLTGGIASGKSEVARAFAERGVPTIDADQVSRALSLPGGAAYDLILQRFGTADRAKLRSIVFSDPKARGDLEAILHPLIRSESERQIAELARAGATTILYDAALLVETGRYRDFDGLIVVEAPLEERIRRLCARDRITEENARGIIAAQTSDEARRKVATEIVRNSGSLEDLRAQVGELLKRL